MSACSVSGEEGSQDCPLDRTQRTLVLPRRGVADGVYDLGVAAPGPDAAAGRELARPHVPAPVVAAQDAAAPVSPRRVPMQACPLRCRALASGAGFSKHSMGSRTFQNPDLA